MRKLLLFCCVLPSGLLFAQNWALINPDYKYNYSNDGTDTISNQVFVTHVDTLGVDSFRYVLNRVGIACMGCTQGLTSSCYYGSSNAVRSEQPQFMGWSLSRMGDQWSVEGVDTLLIYPFNGLGSSWVGPGGITGLITNVEETTLFGSLDSLKWIGYSNGDTLVIARDHGVVLFHASGLGDPSYQLIGRTGLFIEGKQFPNALGIFNYQPNDILQGSPKNRF